MDDFCNEGCRNYSTSKESNDEVIFNSEVLGQKEDVFTIEEGKFIHQQQRDFVKNTDDENNAWHDKRINKKNVLKAKIQTYIDTFTVHGLTKAFKGKRNESAFWFFMVLGGILLSTLLVHALFKKFMKYAVYTEIRSQITEENPFPSLAICEEQLLIDSYFAYCGVAPRIKHKNRSLPCLNKRRNIWTNVTYKNDLFWSNGYFNVTKCQTWSGRKCLRNEYFQTVSQFNNSCVRWNPKGDVYDHVYSHVDLEFQFISPAHLGLVPRLFVLPHDPKIHEIDVTYKIQIEPYIRYNIRLDKTVIKRLPSPFPSKCTNDKSGDIFPGKYTRRGCIESHNYVEIYKKCGDGLDYVQQFIPSDIKMKYYRNKTIRDAEFCIWHSGQSEPVKMPHCAFPCDEVELGVVTTSLKASDSLYRVALQYQRVDTFMLMEEKELYSWDQMACEIGGLIGLVIGASVISIVEILTYLVLVVINKFI